MAIDSDEVISPLPTEGADAGPRTAVSSRTITFGVAVAGVAGVLVATFRYGMGLTPDSVTYINGARSLSAGAGYTANGHAISDFPPGYSWMLSLGEHVGIDALDAARGLSVAALIATIVLGYVVLCRHVRSERVRAVATVSIGCSAVLLEIYEKTLSEHLFLPVLLLFVLVAEEVLNRQRFGVLAAAMVLLAWAAFYLRYAGVVLAVVGALVVVVAAWRRGHLSAFVRGSAFAVAAVSVPIVWMIRNVNAGSGPLGPRADASASIFTNISRAANEFSTWVATDAPPSFVRGVLVVAVFAAIVAGLVALVGGGWSPRQERSLLPLTAFVALYVVYLVASASVVAFAAINTRLMVPVFVPLVVLAAWLFERLGPVVRHASVRRAVTAVALVWVGINVVWFAARAVNSAQNGAGGYAKPRWHDSQLMRDVRHLDFSIPTFSN
ncbi:MAG: hypothetical protein QOH28_1377, partial [Actinomycetota bacterium]|nr:hypothetical protein [Actinomycetota bacterium]